MMPQLTHGASFGAYRVEAIVGAGGMGQVYRATDTRLQRPVAIKVLPPEFANDRDFDARFEREARLLASLSHPNIAGIYGLEEADGVKGLVLEFVDGPTLAERLARGPLSMKEALAIAKQIALALEAAHEKGIIHRDLKPANIKITPGGLVKVLDFGIAKVVDPVFGDATSTGIVLGTPAFMSPEQARGQAVDKRSDIWGFGCVLYAMLTGRGPFTGNTASDCLVNVIEHEPDWKALPAGVPQPIRRLLGRCLQKDPADRLRDIGDAGLEIAEAMSPSAPGPEAHAPFAVTRKVQVGLTVAVLAFVVAAAWWAWRGLTDASGPLASGPYMEVGVTLPNNFLPVNGAVLSPDGRSVAIGAVGIVPQIWLHSFQTAETRALPGAPNGYNPFWSPDSKTIAFFTSNLMTISASGGAPTKIADLPGSSSGGDWSRSGTILFAVDDKLYQLPATGGQPAEVRYTGSAGAPVGIHFLPDDRHFIFFESRRTGGVMHVGSLDSERVTDLVKSDYPGTFAPPDWLLFVRSTTLYAQRLDMRSFALTGAPVVVASGVSRGTVGAVTFQPVALSASRTGSLAFAASRGGSLGQLTWFGRDGRPSASIQAPPGDVEYLNPVLSPDGTQVAANRMDPQTGTWDIWLVDLARNVPSRLTIDPASEFDPVWSADGKELIYVSDRNGRLAFYRQSSTGGPAALVLDVSQSVYAIPTDWSRDGRYLIYHQLGEPCGLCALPLFGDRVPVDLTGQEPLAYAGRLSPDGRWLAYSAAASGQFEVYVRPFLGNATKKQISNGGGVHARWTRDGQEIVYWAVPGGIVANDVSIVKSDVRVGPAHTIVDRPVMSLIDARTHFDITRDGQRLLVRQPAGPPGPGIRVIVNWMAAIAK